jgi:AcrR family transcriptional regulator
VAKEAAVPAPARTSRDAIVAAGRSILEADGIDGLTMHAVARAVGVRAPSLYKHVRDRSDLVRLVLNDIALDLSAAIDVAATTGDPRGDLAAIARAFRTFAHAHPRAYGLLFEPLPDGWRMDSTALAEATRALVRVTAALAGEERALEAARTVTAWSHGFVSMELSSAFQMGGDVDAAFEFGIDRITMALATDPSSGGGASVPGR